MRSYSTDLDSDETLSEVLYSVLPARTFAPGTMSAYSGTNFSLLGYSIQGATGKPYETVLDEILFNPVVMKDTSYEQQQPTDMKASLDLATNPGTHIRLRTLYLISHPSHGEKNEH